MCIRDRTHTDSFWQSIDALTDAVEAQPESRLPGRQRTTVTEVTIETAVWEQALALASYKA